MTEQPPQISGDDPLWQLQGENRRLTAQVQRLRDLNAKLYRRGYQAGYSAGQRNAPPAPAGTDRGRPREHEQRA